MATCIFCNSNIGPSSKCDTYLFVHILPSNYLQARCSKTRERVLPTKYEVQQNSALTFPREKYHSIITKVKPLTDSMQHSTHPDVGEDHYLIQSCGHVAHKKCIATKVAFDNVSREQGCPACRRKFTHVIPWIPAPILAAHESASGLIQLIHTVGCTMPMDAWILEDIQATIYTQLQLELDLLLNCEEETNWKRKTSHFPWNKVWPWAKVTAMSNLSETRSMEWFFMNHFQTSSTDPNTTTQDKSANPLSYICFDPSELLIAAYSLIYGENGRPCFEDVFHFAFQFAYIQSFVICIGSFSPLERGNWEQYCQPVEPAQITCMDELLVNHYFIILSHLNAVCGKDWGKWRSSSPTGRLTHETDVYTLTKVEKDLKLILLPFIRIAVMLSLNHRSSLKQNIHFPHLCTRYSLVNLMDQFDSLLRWIIDPHPRSHDEETYADHLKNPHHKYQNKLCRFPEQLIPDCATLTNLLTQFISPNSVFSSSTDAKRDEATDIDFLLELCPPHLISLPPQITDIPQRFPNFQGGKCYLCLLCGRALETHEHLDSTSHALLPLSLHVSHFCQPPLGLFLHISKGNVLVVIAGRSMSSTYACWGDIYLKSHSDLLILDTHRYELLNSQWISHNLPLILKYWRPLH